MLSVNIDDKSCEDVVFSPSYNIDQLSPIKFNCITNNIPLWYNERYNESSKVKKNNCFILRDDAIHDIYEKILNFIKKLIIVEKERKKCDLRKYEIELLINNALELNYYYDNISSINLKNKIYSLIDSLSINVISDEYESINL